MDESAKATGDSVPEPVAAGQRSYETVLFLVPSTKGLIICAQVQLGNAVSIVAIAFTCCCISDRSLGVFLA